MSRRSLIISCALVVAVLGWWLFRPERLFVDATVDEEFPAASAQQTAARSADPVVLASGTFHGVSHDGAGTATVYQLAEGKRVLRFTDFATSNGPAPLAFRS